MKEKAEEILTKASVEEETLDKFSEGMLKYLTEEVRSVADKYKCTSKKREYLWSMFHKIRIRTSFQAWSELLKKLDITIDDPLLEQSVYQEVFEVVMKEYFDCSVSESMTKCTVDNISPNELNVI